MKPSGVRNSCEIVETKSSCKRIWRWTDSNSARASCKALRSSSEAVQ